MEVQATAEVHVVYMYGLYRLEGLIDKNGKEKKFWFNIIWSHLWPKLFSCQVHYWKISFEFGEFDNDRYRAVTKRPAFAIIDQRRLWMTTYFEITVRQWVESCYAKSHLRSVKPADRLCPHPVASRINFRKELLWFLTFWVVNKKWIFLIKVRSCNIHVYIHDIHHVWYMPMLK